MFEKGVCEILADKFDADASTMTMDTKVKEDLNADSLDVVELMMDLEENFGVTISDEEAAKMSTIGDIVNQHRSKPVRALRFSIEGLWPFNRGGCSEPLAGYVYARILRVRL